MDDESGGSPAHAVDFRPALVDSRLFPLDTFRQVSVKQLRRLERKPARYKSPQGNQGNFSLRDAITKHISLTRAVACRPEDIVITSGAQQAFDLLARVLVKRDETVVAIEDPGYPPMRVAFAAAGAKVVPVGTDDEGLIIEKLPADVGLICVCPSHQFPLGVTMSRRRREALIEFARNRGAVIIEDDYDGEFRYDRTPLQALRSSDETDLVFYVGTFSKCMLPSLRLGYVVASDWALPSLVAAKNCLDWHCPAPIQLSVAAFMEEGHLRRHIRKMRSLYADRRELILTTLQRDFADSLVAIPAAYGMHITAVARRPLDLDAVAETLTKQHVCIHTLSRYYLGQPSVAGLIFGFGTTDLAQLKRGLSAVRKALPR
jgi:GntR family transcriptional regulator/MocR family aminotransferase